MSHYLHPSLWRMSLGLIVLLAALPLITGCDTSASSTTSSGSNTPHVVKPLAEHLTFTEDISGILVSGEAPHPLTHDNPIPDFVEQKDGTFTQPAPTWTQCSDFDVNSGALRDYVAVVVGKVGSSGRYAIAIEINEDNPAYTKPGTSLLPGTTNSGGSVEVFELAGQHRTWQQGYGPNLQDTTIVLHADRASGTVDAWLATGGQSQKDANTTLHVQGDWRCG